METHKRLIPRGQSGLKTGAVVLQEGKKEDQPYVDKWAQYNNAKTPYIIALQKKYPAIPFGDIIKNNAKPMSREELENVTRELQAKYGDFYLSPEESSSVAKGSGSDLRAMLPGLAERNTLNVTGGKENGVAERVGPRYILQTADFIDDQRPQPINTLKHNRWSDYAVTESPVIPSLDDPLYPYAYNSKTDNAGRDYRTRDTSFKDTPRNLENSVNINDLIQAGDSLQANPGLEQLRKVYLVRKRLKDHPEEWDKFKSGGKILETLGILKRLP